MTCQKIRKLHTPASTKWEKRKWKWNKICYKFKIWSCLLYIPWIFMTPLYINNAIYIVNKLHAWENCFLFAFFPSSQVSLTLLCHSKNHGGSLDYETKGTQPSHMIMASTNISSLPEAKKPCWKDNFIITEEEAFCPQKGKSISFLHKIGNEIILWRDFFWRSSRHEHCTRNGQYQKIICTVLSLFCLYCAVYV